MSSITTADVLVGKKRRGPHARRRINLPDGDYLEPREEFGKDTLGVSDKTVERMHLPTIYVGGVAYVRHNASLGIIASRIREPGKPPKRRGRR